MEDIDTVDDLEINLQPKRTVFLTVLCILTWSYSLVCLLGVLVFFKWSSFSTNQYDFMLSYVFSPVLCSIGAILMWNLNRFGYLLYVLSALAPLVFDIVTFMRYSSLNESGIFMLILNSLPSIIFVVLYSLNLSTMRPIKK